MEVDIYSVEEDKEFGPILLSLDYNFLTSFHYGRNGSGLFPHEGMNDFTNLFFPKDMRTLKNGLKNKVLSEKFDESSLVDKLSNDLEKISSRRTYVINKYGVPSVQNFYMVSLQRVAEGMHSFVKHASENSKDVLTVTHNAKPIPMKLAKFEETSGFCGIHNADITTFDPESETYTGNIFWSDYLEGMNNNSPFIAHKLPEELGFKENQGLFVRSRERNFLTGDYEFTLLPDFNKEMSDYINEMIFKK